MKLSKELNDALEAVSKEVDTWPAWKRSIDLYDRKKAKKKARTTAEHQCKTYEEIARCSVCSIP